MAVGDLRPAEGVSAAGEAKIERALAGMQERVINPTPPPVAEPRAGEIGDPLAGTPKVVGLTVQGVRRRVRPNLAAARKAKSASACKEPRKPPDPDGRGRIFDVEV